MSPFGELKDIRIPSGLYLMVDGSQAQVVYYDSRDLIRALDALSSNGTFRDGRLEVDLIWDEPPESRMSSDGRPLEQRRTIRGGDYERGSSAREGRLEGRRRSYSRSRSPSRSYQDGTDYQDRISAPLFLPKPISGGLLASLTGGDSSSYRSEVMQFFSW